jgi:hypothetical protein
MAEKVFQLLERLKLAELGKTKAMEALQKKEMEMIALKKKNSRLIKESTKEGKARVKAELDKKVLQDQIRALKKHNAQLSQRCREEVQLKLKEHEERAQAEEKVKTLGGRLSFLLNKMQSDEESKVVRNEEMKKMEAQIKTLSERCEDLVTKVEETGESNRIITQAMRLKQNEVEELTIRCDALTKVQEEEEAAQNVPETEEGLDVDAVKAAGGRGRFYMESKPSLGLVLLKGKRSNHRTWLEKHGVNAFLKQAQKTNRFKEMAVERLAQVYALLMVEEEETQRLHGEVATREEHVEHLSRKNSYLQDKLGSEEDAKRRTLLRYVNAVKASALSETKDGSGTGAIQLPESGITDEEVHAIAALLRGNTSIVDLNLRGNLITDEGARALSAVLGGRSGIQSLDLRGNRIGKLGIRAMAEALERSDRVRHVYVHAGGKIEALGTNRWADPRLLNATGGGEEGGGGGGGDQSNGELAAAMVTVETVCVVDCRENNPSAAGDVGDGESSAQQQSHSQAMVAVITGAQSTQPAHDHGGPSSAKQHKSKKSKISNSKEDQLRKEEAARLKALNRRKAEEERRAASMEMGWDGRAGGMELRLPPAPGSRNSNSAEERPMGSRSAPLLGTSANSSVEALPKTIGASKSNKK